MAVRSNDTNSCTLRQINELTSRGKFREAVDLYWKVIADGIKLPPGAHHAAYVAAGECGASDGELEAIHANALAESGTYSQVELDFARDDVINRAEKATNKRDILAALQEITEIIRSRNQDEGQDRSKVIIDEIARAKILILLGEVEEAWLLLNLLIGPESGQTALNLTWWRFVAADLTGRYCIAGTFAKTSLATGLDPKPTRQWTWRLARIPWFGPRLARVLIKRKLKPKL